MVRSDLQRPMALMAAAIARIAMVKGAPHSASFPLILFVSSFFDVVISSTYFVHSVKLSFGLLLRDSQSKQTTNSEIRNDHCCKLHFHIFWPLTLSLHDWVCCWENCWTNTPQPKKKDSGQKQNKKCMCLLEKYVVCLTWKFSWMRSQCPLSRLHWPISPLPGFQYVTKVWER